MRIKNILTTFTKAIAAGILINIGAIAKLSVENKYLGAFLFSIGLLFICSKQFNLFTGKIGYIAKEKFNLIPIWLGNFVGCILAGGLIRTVCPSIAAASQAAIQDKFLQPPTLTFVLAAFCGIIMYLAVDNFKTSENRISQVSGVIIGVMVFILCGFEHSIADMAYFVMGTSIDTIWRGICYILLVTFGNSVGAIILNYLPQIGGND